MMRHPEHHHHYQRNRPAPPQRMLVSVPGGPHPGVLVSMSPSTPTMLNTITPMQQPHQPKTNTQQVYYDPMPNETSDMQQAVEQAQQISNTTTSSNLPNLANMKEKTPMCLVNELARYNKIQHQYKLTGEQGPAHKKIFTVTLKLGNEEYEAEGASIKKAQHSAAALALEKTQLRRPPPKTTRHIKPGNLRTNGTGMVTPTVELNALAMKRGERTVYIVENGVPPQPQGYVVPYYNRHNMYPPGQPRYNYDARRNQNIRGQFQYENRYHAQYNKPGYQQSNGEICSVRLKVGEREYPGSGATIQAARHDAATRAIEEIKKLNDEEEQQQQVTSVVLPSSVTATIVAEENGKDDDKASLSDISTELKSPISLVHEIALKRHLNVVFEVKSENGPPHMKVFVTICKIADVMVEGEGHGKKISKKRAAEKMLQKLSQLPPLPPAPNTTQIKRKRITNKKKTRNLVKVNSDKPSDYVEDINPISRLIQIQQANKEKEPVYTVVEERGAARRREFVIQAAVNGVSANGVGPNKKLAKRAAAQALLNQLGFSTPQVGAAKQATSKPEKDGDSATNNVAASNAEKQRKVTFLEEKQPDAPVGGSGGRQLVPGLLIVGDQTAHNKPKASSEANASFNKETTPAKKVTPQKITPPPAGGVRSKDKLMYLVQLMNIQAQFSDFPKANHEMYLTLVSLSTNPPQVCHGEGPTIEASHEKAALEALNVLSEMGLDNTVPSKELSTNEVKE